MCSRSTPASMTTTPSWSAWTGPRNSRRRRRGRRYRRGPGSRRHTASGTGATERPACSWPAPLPAPGATWRSPTAAGGGTSPGSPWTWPTSTCPAGRSCPSWPAPTPTGCRRFTRPPGRWSIRGVAARRPPHGPPHAEARLLARHRGDRDQRAVPAVPRPPDPGPRDDGARGRRMAAAPQRLGETRRLAVPDRGRADQAEIPIPNNLIRMRY